MGNKLRLGYKRFVLAAVLVILVAIGLTPDIFGQIIVSSSDYTQVVFSETEEYTGTGNQILNLTRLENSGEQAVLSSNYRMLWSNPVNSVNGDKSPLYKTSNLFNSTSLVLDTREERKGIFATFSIKNNTGKFIEGLNLTFDWALEEGSEIDLIYKYKSPLSGSGAAEPAGTDLISENRIDGLISLFEKVSIYEILLKPGDELEVTVLWDSNTLNSEIALNKIGITPVIFDSENSINTGSLLVTEIMPSTETSGGEIQFVEIYNASGNPVSLRGLEFVGQNFHGIIDKNVTLDPYCFFVVGKSDISNLPFDFDYEFQNMNLPSSGGSLKILFHDREIVKASYSSITENASWKLNHFSEAYDGYTSMSSFIESDELFAGSIKASPGHAGKASRIFTNSFNHHTWHLTSLPGIPENSLNKNFRVPFYSMNIDQDLKEPFWEPVSINDLEQGQVVLIYPTDELSGRKLTTVENNSQSEFNYKPTPHLPYSVAGNPFPDVITTANLRLDNGESYSGAVQVWNAPDKTFELVKNSTDTISVWQAFIYNSSAAGSGLMVVNDSENDINRNASFVSFELTVSDEKELLITDRAAMVEFDVRQEMEKNITTDVNLPKFFPISIQNQNNEDSFALLYITQSETSTPNSYLKIINNQDQAKTEFYLTPIASKFSGNGTLNWNMQHLNTDEEEFILHDLKQGEQLKMNALGSYTFALEENGFNILPQVNNKPGLYTIHESSVKPRFKVEIKRRDADNISRLSETGEIPKEIKLDQNYPNPFNPVTTIRFYLPDRTAVKISIFNIVGQRVATLIENILPEGEHTISWDASEMPSGIYIAQLETGNRVLTRKMTLLK